MLLRPSAPDPWAFLRMALSTLMDFLLSWLTPELLFLGLASLMLSQVRFLSMQLREIIAVLSSMRETAEFSSQKINYLEFRLSKAQSTTSDSLRHLQNKISEFDSSVGDWGVLLRWITEERDNWLMRRSALSWLVLSQAVQLKLLAEVIYQRIMSVSGFTEELDLQTERLLENLRHLRRVLPESKWHRLSSLEETAPLPEGHLSADMPVFEMVSELLEKHRVYLKKLAQDQKRSWSSVTAGLSINEIFGSESMSSSAM